MTLEEYIKLVRSYMEKAQEVINELHNTLALSVKNSDDLLQIYKQEHVIAKRMKSLLERLAPESGLYVLDEYENPISCIFCGESSYKEFLGDEPVSIHEAECPWVEARKLLEELK